MRAMTSPVTELVICSIRSHLRGSVTGELTCRYPVSDNKPLAARRRLALHTAALLLRSFAHHGAGAVTEGAGHPAHAGRPVPSRHQELRLPDGAIRLQAAERRHLHHQHGQDMGQAADGGPGDRRRREPPGHCGAVGSPVRSAGHPQVCSVHRREGLVRPAHSRCVRHPLHPLPR